MPDAPIETTPAGPAKTSPLPAAKTSPTLPAETTPASPAEAASASPGVAGLLEAGLGDFLSASTPSQTFLSVFGPILQAVAAKTLHYPIVKAELLEAVQKAAWAAQAAHELAVASSFESPTPERLAEKLYGYEAADWPTEAEPWRPWSMIPESAKEPRVRVAAALLADFVVLPKG